MKKGAGLLIIACLYVFLTFNSTLPLNRNSAHHTYANQSQTCVLMERTKKMASNLENTLRRIKDSTQDISKNIFDHLNSGIKKLANKDAITEDDIRQYEELVIMKKYPYLDLKELQMKYSPLSSKNTRQSAIFPVDRNSQNEPSISDTVEDVLNVEIINRGLSGFAIPPLFTKHTGIADNKLMNNVIIKTNNEPDDFDHSKKPNANHNILNNLKQDVNAYLEKVKIKK